MGFTTLEIVFGAVVVGVALVVGVWYYCYQQFRDQEYMQRRAMAIEEIYNRRIEQSNNVSFVQEPRQLSTEELQHLCDEQGRDCPICLEEFTPDDSVAELACPGHHKFHRQCVGDWLKQSDKCPVCRGTHGGEPDQNTHNQQMAVVVSTSTPLCRRCGNAFTRDASASSDQPGYYFCHRCSQGRGLQRFMFII